MTEISELTDEQVNAYLDTALDAIAEERKQGIANLSGVGRLVLGIEMTRTELKEMRKALQAQNSINIRLVRALNQFLRLSKQKAETAGKENPGGDLPFVGGSCRHRIRLVIPGKTPKLRS